MASRLGRIHDVGGLHGFGVINPGKDQPFYEGWEARIYGIHRALRVKEVYGEHLFRHAIEQLDPSFYLSVSYYERWLPAIEALLIEQGVLVGGDVDGEVARIESQEAGSQDHHTGGE